MIIWNGKIDIVFELRKNNWLSRAFGITIGQLFLGVIIFRRKSNDSN